MNVQRKWKRCLTACLCLLLALAMLAPPPALAADMQAGLGAETFGYTLSQAGVDLIKEFEGFRSMAYYDNGSWYIGYGCLCGQDEYPNGIDEFQGEILLRRAVADAEGKVNRLLSEQLVPVTQYQFDALVSLTYNIGNQWIKQGVRLYDYLMNGVQYYTEQQVVNAFGTWCHQNGQVLSHLVGRRLREAFLFLYGEYSNSGSSAYTYIKFDAAGGVISPSSIWFYPVGRPYGQLPVPTYEGHDFLGWYTADGAALTEFDLADKTVNVTAKWSGVTELPGTTAPSGTGVNVGETMNFGELFPTYDPFAPKGSIDNTADYSAWVNPFTDVKEGDWYYPYARELNAKGIMVGFSDKTFRSTSVVSAGEALKLILLAAGQEDPGNAKDGRGWAALYLDLAESLGCVAAGEIQDLSAPLDRQTIARITAVALGLESMEGLYPFADTEDGYALALYIEGIFQGVTVGGQRYFNPTDSISRGELCAVVARVSDWSRLPVTTQDPLTPEQPGSTVPEGKNPSQTETNTPVNDPAVTGYIQYGNQKIPVLPNVPATPYDPDLFQRVGSLMYYNDPFVTTETGIDVSRHQGQIDWQKVAASGMVDFAILRVGGRYAGTDNGTIYADERFQENLAGAKAAGLKTGVYFYSQAITVEEAVEEAQYVIDQLGGTYLEYPVAFDWEVYSSSARTKGLGVQELTDCAIAFCETVRAAGYDPILYLGFEVAYKRMDLSRLTDYPFWFAQYKSDNRPDMYYDYRIWQYSSKGEIPGISEKVDMNIAMVPYESGGFW